MWHAHSLLFIPSTRSEPHVQCFSVRHIKAPVSHLVFRWGSVCSVGLLSCRILKSFKSSSPAKLPWLTLKTAATTFPLCPCGWAGRGLSCVINPYTFALSVSILQFWCSQISLSGALHSQSYICRVWFLACWAQLCYNSSPWVFPLNGDNEKSAGVRSLPLTLAQSGLQERERRRAYCNKDSYITIGGMRWKG